MPTKARPAPSGEFAATDTGPRILKKYPNRRLYDTQTSSYITLTDVKDMVMRSVHFEVRDAKTGDDLTRSILLQIILEEETGGAPIFTSQMLAQLIRFYGHTMQGMMGAYLERNLQTFVELQTQFANSARGDAQPFTPEAWTQWLTGQSPMVQGLMGNYAEQSRQLFTQMQEQLAKQATLFPGMPGFTAPKR
jgi:polyhydroxyalkanoate synthesis repressor PhaR